MQAIKAGYSDRFMSFVTAVRGGNGKRTFFLRKINANPGYAHGMFTPGIIKMRTVLNNHPLRYSEVVPRGLPHYREVPGACNKPRVG